MQNSSDRDQYPSKLELVHFRGPDRRKASELCICLFLLRNNNSILPKLRLSKKEFGHSVGPSELGRPPCKQPWNIKPHEALLSCLKVVDTAT